MIGIAILLFLLGIPGMFLSAEGALPGALAILNGWTGVVASVGLIVLGITALRGPTPTATSENSRVALHRTTPPGHQEA